MKSHDRSPPSDAAEILSLSVKTAEACHVRLADSDEDDPYVTVSPEIVSTLLVAFFNRSRVELILIPDTRLLKRVYAFDIVPPARELELQHPHAPPEVPMKYDIVRMATQRFADVRDHLELFTKNQGGQHVNVNIYDPLQKLICCAAAAFQQPVYLVVDPETKFVAEASLRHDP